MRNGSARAVADLEEGLVLASVEVAAPPEVVFRELASDAVCDWWVRPGVFDTTAWAGEVRRGGHWRASGTGKGRPYALEGEFLDVEPPRRLVHTWRFDGVPTAPTTVTYAIDAIDGGSRITLRHAGFATAEACDNTAKSWETSFDRLAERLGAGQLGGRA